VVVPAADLQQRSDYFEPGAVQDDRGTHRRPPGKQVLAHLVAQYDDPALLFLIERIQPAALSQRKKPYLTVLRLYPDDLAVGAGELAGGAHVVPRENRGDVAYVLRLVGNVGAVLVGELIGPGGVHAAGHGGRAAGEGEHDVFAELLHVALVARP